MNHPTSSLSRRIDRAIIPSAGYGTRLRPLTLAVPKEMLPLGRRPVLEYVVNECREARIQRLLFVVSPGKEMIERYFGDGAAFGVRCDYVVQREMRGLGDAVLHGESWSEGEPFVVAFGDCVVHSPGSPPLARLLETHARTAAQAVVLVEPIPRERARSYGIVAPAAGSGTDKAFRLADIVEKPEPDEAPSTLAVAARWALDAGIFAHLRAAAPGPNGEVNLTDPVRAWLGAGASVWAEPLRTGESRWDLGDWTTYLTAIARAALLDAECGPAVRAALRDP